MRDSKDLTSVFTGSRLEANVIIEILKDNSIPVLFREKFQNALQAGFVDGVAGDVELMVELEDEPRAKEFIVAYEKSIS